MSGFDVMQSFCTEMHMSEAFKSNSTMLRDYKFKELCLELFNSTLIYFGMHDMVLKSTRERHSGDRPRSV